MPNLRTPAQAREWLERQGKSVADFARDNSLDLHTCYQILAGTKKGIRGEAHRAAVLLGIKEGVVQQGLQADEQNSSQAHNSERNASES